MRILMVSPYPPVRDGIAAYAVQSVTALRRAGHRVEVLSPFPSAAHHHLDLASVAGVLRLAALVTRFDMVILQYHPDVFFRVGMRVREREAIAAALTIAWRRARRVEIRVHEADYSRVHRGPATAATRAMWRAATRIVVHTEVERNAFHRSLGLPLEKIDVEPHGRHFVRRTSLTREQARERLRLPASETVFLSIGFIQPHKGFDRGIHAFAALGNVHGIARFDIVGSVRVAEPGYLAHLDELQRLAQLTPAVHLHPGYVGDTEFDAWIVAADALVLPYRHIWSSGVLERAALYDRRVIATRVGGLSDQARSHTELVDDDAELVEAMRRVVAEAHPAAATSSGRNLAWPAASSATRGSVSRVISERAALQRGSPLVRRQPSASSADVAAGTAPRSALALHPLQLPPPSSRRAANALAKRLVQRLTRWELDPIVQQINELQQVVSRTVAVPTNEPSAQDPPSERPLP